MAVMMALRRHLDGAAAGQPRAAAQPGPPQFVLEAQRGAARPAHRASSSRTATSSPSTPRRPPCCCAPWSSAPAAPGRARHRAHPRPDRRRRCSTASAPARRRRADDAAPHSCASYLAPYRRPLAARRRCCSSSAPWPRCTCPASTPTSSTTASSPATPATSCAPARHARRSSLVQIVCSVGAVWFGARTAMGVRPRRPRGAVPPGRHVLQPRGAALRRAVADHPQHQRRAAGADAGADGVHADGVAAPIMMVGGVIMAMREDLGLSWLLAVVRAGAVPRRRLRDLAGWCRASG